MRQRLRTLLAVLLQTLAEGGSGIRPLRRRFHERAAAAGFAPADVEGLLAWLLDRPGLEQPLAAGDPESRSLERPGGVRCLAEEEALALTPEAFGYLLELSHRRQISRRQMERLIQVAALVADAPLGRREVADLLEQILFWAHAGQPAAGADQAGPH